MTVVKISSNFNRTICILFKYLKFVFIILHSVAQDENPKTHQAPLQERFPNLMGCNNIIQWSRQLRMSVVNY